MLYINKDNYVVLPMYSTNKIGEKHVLPQSGLNSWRGDATKRYRQPDEIYIRVPVAVHKISPNFFPQGHFPLLLPNGSYLQVSLCQQGKKALMSDPNVDIGHWMLREVLRIPENTQVTYEMLEQKGIDSVIITKSNNAYSIVPAPVGSYENFLNSSNF